MISIHKGTKAIVRMAIYDNYSLRTPIDLTQFLDFVCVIVDDGHLLIEKRFTKNGILREKLGSVYNVLRIVFMPEDTANININPSSEERLRDIEMYGIGKDDGKPVLLYKDQFFLEGSGYYVKSLF